MFGRLVYSALATGLLAGLLLSAIQLADVSPIIYAAETYEVAEPEGGPLSALYDAPLIDNALESDNHEGEAWAPEDGVERIAFTFLSNICAAIGFALLLIPCMLLATHYQQRRIEVYEGLLWGIAGYLVFFVSPSLGLVPEIPGAAAAEIGQRQAWWLTTALVTAAGLACVFFVRNHYRWLGILLLPLPHIMGAPHPDGPLFSHPAPAAVAALEQLQTDFFIATAIANGLYWLALGTCAGWMIRRWLQPPDNEQPTQQGQISASAQESL